MWMPPNFLVFGGFIILLSLFANFILNPKPLLAISTRKLMLLLMPLILFSVLTPPIFSRDILAYLLPARNFVEFGGTPYVTKIQNFDQNPWTTYIKHEYNGASIYGPVFNILMSFFFIFKSESLYFYLLLYKIFIFGLYILDIILITKLVNQLQLSPLAVKLFILNPSIIIHLLMDAHNDSIMLTLILATIYFMLSNRVISSYTSLILASGIKYLPLFLIPIYWFKNKVFQLKNAFISIGVTLVLWLSFILVFPGFINNFFFTSNHFATKCIYNCMLGIPTLRVFLGDNFIFIMRISFILVWLYLYYKYIYLKSDVIAFIIWAYLAFNYFITIWVTSWALMIPLVMSLLLCTKKKYVYLSLYITMYSLFHYFGV